MGFPRHRFGQQGLTCTGRAYQQCALGESGADLRIFPRIVQEIHHFHQGFLRLIFPCHILERDTGLLLYIDLGVALTYAQRTAGAAHFLKYHAQQNPHQQYRQYHIQQYIQYSS